MYRRSPSVLALAAAAALSAGVCARAQTRRTMTEEIAVKLRNQKSEPVAVIVKENLYRWLTWNIVQKRHDFRKEDARTVHFPVRLGPGAEAEVRYSVQYTW